jgi:4-hydroxy-3-polyprenylbenzoate decarboxylase
MLQDKNHLVQGTIPRLTRPRDVETMVQKYAAKKEPLPFAIVLGVAPSVFFAAAQLSPPHVDDAAIAGGYMLDPIPTVKAKLSDILVPADAEIVLEGHIYPGDTADEGPFGGVSSYTPKMRNFVYSVELISHRNEPILPFVAEGMMPSDTVNIFSVFHSHDLMTFCGMLGVPIRYVTIPVEARLVLAIVSLRKKRLLGGFPFRAARTIFGMSPLVRQLIVIDEDVDSEDLATALGDAVVKAHPLKDYHISKIDKPLGWTENHDWETGLTSTLAIDAAFRVDKEPETLPTRVGFEHIIPVEVQKEVIRKWNEVLKLKPTAWSYHNE